jgi:hypothetical protein
MGNHAFSEESKHHNLPRIKTVQNPYSLNRLYETVSRNWLSRKCGLLILQWLWCYQEILTGENILKQGFIYFLNIQGTTAPNVLKQQSYIRKLLKKWLTNRVVLAFIEQQCD